MGTADHRPGLTRSTFLKAGAAFAAVAAIDGTLSLPPASASSSDRGRADPRPRPIPGGFDENFNFVATDPLAHAFFPIIGLDLSTITDFRGTVAGTEVQGRASGSDGTEYWFDADMRFMEGQYVAFDGRRREHAFAFV